MAALVSALDAQTPKQVGENMNPEYGWSSDIQEKILQLTFQLTRTSEKKILDNLSNIYTDLISICYKNNDIEHLTTLFKIMLHTRDIINGKGEYTLFYNLLLGTVKLSLSSSDKMFSAQLDRLINKTIYSLLYLDNGEHPYGTWKDLKYVLNVLNEGLPGVDITTLSVFKYIIQLYVNQITIDKSNLDKHQTDNSPLNMSLCGRWCPREKSKKFGWIAKHIAFALNPRWINSANTNSSKRAATKKCLEFYRRTVAQLNNALETVQVKQCSQEWSSIDFNKQVTSVTMARQKKAFLYVDKKGEQRGHSLDRKKCADNFNNYLTECFSGDKNIKASRVSIIDMIRDAVNLSKTYGSPSEKMALNLQWDEAGKFLELLSNFIALVDTSGSMEVDNCNPLNAAVGLGIRVAEKSKLGKRVLTFSKSPQWINLDPYDNLIDMCKRLRTDDTWGMNTDFRKAMQLIADACLEKQLSPQEVSDLVLVVFSDMQIDLADKDNSTMHEFVERLFKDTGMKSKFKTPFTPPHMLYWNLKSTGGFPELSTKKNISMLSGFSPVLLNSFCNKGMDCLKECTPWHILAEQLDNERYSWCSSFIQEVFSNNISDPLDKIEFPLVLDDEPELLSVEGSVSTPTDNKTNSSGWFW